MAKAATRLLEMRRLLESRDPIALIDTLKTPPADLIKLAPNDEKRAVLLSYFGFHEQKKGNAATAFPFFEQAYALDNQVKTLTNTLIVARRAKDAVSQAKRTALLDMGQAIAAKLTDSDQKAELFDVLCQNCGAWGDLEAAAQHGRSALQIKDDLQTKSFDLEPRKRPDFDFNKPNRNVIAFSLFGSKSRYLTVAIENAKACRYIYPGWSCRFYVDKSVPEEALKALASNGSQILMLPKPHDPASASGLFWRFEVASDSNVDFFMVRDADSLISVREKNAVDEWIASDRDFHVLRDFYSHSELVLGGLWGGVAGRIGNIRGLIETYNKKRKQNLIGVHNHDQLFLRSVIWPTIKQTLMQHDSVFGWQDGNSNMRNFPPFGHIQPVRHVGQNMGVFMKNGGED